MKRIIFASLLALCLLSFPAPRSTSAQTAGGSAGGNFSFMDENGLTRFLEFSATGNNEGGATGGMTYHDPSPYPDEDNDGEPPSKPTREMPAEFYVKAEFNTMTVDKNRAVMNGTIVDSSHRTYIGKYVQLVVEDNAENPRLSDQLSWQICKQQPGGWIPSDFEVKDDKGAFLSWWATDAERKDDVGIPSKNLIPGELKSCQIYPLGGYSFYNFFKWEGDIVVRAG